MAFRTLLVLVVAAPLLVACGAGPEQPSGGAPETAGDVSTTPQPVQPETLPAGETAEAETATRPAAPMVSSAPTNIAEVTGRWAEDSAWCSDESAGFPITITADRFEGRENSCDIIEFIDNGDGFTATLSCQSEGMTETELLKMRPDNGRLGISYLGRDAGETTLLRCEE